MDVVRDPALIARVQTTLDLFETACAMMRQNLRRRFPQADQTLIEEKIQEWLLDRPGAAIADAGGPVRVRRIPE